MTRIHTTDGWWELKGLVQVQDLQRISEIFCTDGIQRRVHQKASFMARWKVWTSKISVTYLLKNLHKVPLRYGLLIKALRLMANFFIANELTQGLSLSKSVSGFDTCP
jgi:hypothetical protein